jgi:trk system potassium uptake protein TrkA
MLGDSGLEIVDVKISPESTTIGKSVETLSLPSGSVLFLIIRRDNKPFVPAANTVIQAGDQIIAVTPPESEESLRIALRGS